MRERDRGPVVVALGGNAIAPATEPDTPDVEIANITATMTHMAELVADGFDLIITHGNGPQVGAVLRKNELARHELPPIPLDWCVAETQATIGFVIANALGWELDRRGLARPVVPVVSRVRVAPDDPAFGRPSKPIGGYLDDEDEVRRRERDGQHFVHHPDRGWRRVVASPEPLESMDRRAAELLIEDGAVVVTNGGGGIPVTAGDDGRLHGVEAVIDKDLAASVLAVEVGAERLIILTDVDGVAVGYGTADARWLGDVSATELRDHGRRGEFAAGSMGPKVEAVCRFVERSGRSAAIGALGCATDVVRGDRGTQVRA